MINKFFTMLTKTFNFEEVHVLCEVSGQKQLKKKHRSISCDLNMMDNDHITGALFNFLDKTEKRKTIQQIVKTPWKNNNMSNHTGQTNQ